MNFLLLTGPYYPHRSPVSNCINPYIEELLKNHNVTLVCPSTSFGLNPLVCDNLEIIYITNWWNTARYNEKKYGIFASVIIWLVRIIGVIHSLWAFPTRHNWMRTKFLHVITSILNKGNTDVVISMSDPTCAHLAVLDYFERYGKKVRWITYSTDPYTFNNAIYQNVLFKRIRYVRNFNYEKRIYQTCDTCIFTEQLYEKCLREFDIPKDKSLVLPYIFPETNRIKNSIIKDNQLVVVYAGALNKVIRSPKGMMANICKINDVYFNLYVSGDCNSILDSYKRDNIHISGLLSRDEYEKTIVEADILINLGNSNSLQSPSKFFELLSLGKPILNFYYNEDSNYKIVEQYPLGLNINNKEVVPEKIHRFCINMKDKCISFDEIKKLFPSHVFENCYAEFYKKLLND